MLVCVLAEVVVVVVDVPPADLIATTFGIGKGWESIQEESRRDEAEEGMIMGGCMVVVVG